jgi:hypothetical protein
MAGVLGIEPRDGGIKIRCLTAWLYPKKKKYHKIYHEYSRFGKKIKIVCGPFHYVVCF